MKRLFSLAGAAAATLVLAPAPAVAGTNSVTFSAAGSQYTVTVPPDGPDFDVVAVGGHGGGSSSGATGGLGAKVTGRLATGGSGEPAPGDVLHLYLGNGGAPGTLGAGAGGAPTFLRTAPLSASCTPWALGSDSTLLVAGAGGGGASSVGDWTSMGGDGGDAGSSGADGLGVGSGGSPTGGGGAPEGSAIGGSSTMCPAGGSGGAGAGGMGTGATATRIDGVPFALGGAGGDGGGAGGGGGGGALGGGGGGGSENGTGGGGAGGASDDSRLVGGLSNLALGTENPSLTLAWDDTAKPEIGFNRPATSWTNDLTQAISGRTSTGLGDPSQVELVSDGPGPADRTSEQLPVIDGAWSTRARTYTQGAWTFTIDATDGGGNSADQRWITVNFDTQAPTVSIVEPADGYVTSSTPVFSGATSDDPGDDPELLLEVLQGETTLLAEQVTRSGVQWSAQMTEVLDEGEGYRLRVTQGDLAGNTPAVATADFTVDTKAPALTVTGPDEGARVITALPKITGTRGTASDDSAPVVSFRGNGQHVVGTVTSDAGSFTATPATELSAGSWSVTVTQWDAAGNSTRVDRTIQVTPSSVHLQSIASPTTDTTPSFTGIGARPADGGRNTVQVVVRSDDDGPVVQTHVAEVDNQGIFRVDAEPLAHGTYTAQAFQADHSGHTIASQPRTFTIDVRGPEIELSSPMAGATPSRRPLVAGTTDESGNVTVQFISAGGTTTTATVTPSAGAFSYEPASDLAEQAYTVRVRQRDAVLNETVVERQIRVDATPPTPTLDAPGALVSARPVLKGLGGGAVGDLPVVTIDIYPGANPSGLPVQTLEAAVHPNNSFEVVADDLADGTYTARVGQGDDAGNAGTSEAHTFTVDGQPPDVQLTAPPARSNDATPTFAGTSSDPGAVTVTVRRAADGSVVATLPATRTDLAFTATLTGATLADGTYTVQAAQEDSAGNVGSSALHVFVVDTVGPAVTVASPNGPVKSPLPIVSGTAGRGPDELSAITVTVTPAAGEPLVLHTTRDDQGEWSAAPPTPLADGDYTVRATQQDEAGNTGQSPAASFTVDTQAPQLTLTGPSGVTNDATPAVTATAGNAPGDAGTVTVVVRRPDQSLAAQITLTRQGNLLSGDLPEIPDGEYSVFARQADAAGNVATAGPLELDVDLTQPQPALTEPAQDEVLRTGTPQFKGIGGIAPGDLRPVAVVVRAQGDFEEIATAPGSADPLTGEFTAALKTALADGVYTARVRQSDQAGNLGESSPVTFTIDTQAPTVSLSLPLTAGRTNDPTPRLSGRAEPDLPLAAQVLSDGEVVRDLPVTPAEDGTYSVTTDPPLPDGAYVARAVQSDRAANVGRSADVAFVVDTVAPAIAIRSPLAGATTPDRRPEVTGIAGTADGDTTALHVTFTGPQNVTVEGARTSSGAFAVRPPEPLPVGSYTLQAVQLDAAGNTGKSSHVAFTIADEAKSEPTPTPSPHPSATPAPTPTPPPSAKPVAKVGTRVTMDRRGRLKLTVTCGPGTGSCQGTVRALLRKRALTRAATFEIAAGQQRTVALPLTQAGRRLARRATSVTVQLASDATRLSVARRLTRQRSG